MYIQSAAGAIWVKQEQKEIYKNFCLIELGLHAVTVFLFSCMGILIIPFVKIYTDGLTDANYIQPIFAAVLVTAYGIRCLRTPYNIWILAAGHFKETYKCHITAAVLNLSASVIAVFYLGLVGVAVGTLIAMCFQTVWMMCYTARNLVKCNFLHILKQFSADIVMVISICFLTANITLQNTSYFDWFVMAMQVALISIICIISVICIFYPKEIKCIINKFIKNTLKSVPKGLIK